MGTSNTALTGEVVILSSDDGSLSLTNYRVKHEVVNQSNSSYKSIPIDKVAACSLNTRTYPMLLVLAVVAALLVFVLPELPQRIGAGVAAVVLIALYFGTRNGQIQIFSDSGESIAVPTKGLSHDQVKAFLEAVATQYQAVRNGDQSLMHRRPEAA